MCDFNNGIRFCKCENDKILYRQPPTYKKINGELIEYINKKNAKIPLIYIWQLFRKKQNQLMEREIGQYKMPTNDIGKGLNAEWIALNLNFENCFDFEYFPQEGDNLIIGKNEILSKYISFIFTNNQWVEDHYNPFLIEIESVDNGVLEHIK